MDSNPVLSKETKIIKIIVFPVTLQCLRWHHPSTMKATALFSTSHHHQVADSLLTPSEVAWDSLPTRAELNIMKEGAHSITRLLAAAAAFFTRRSRIVLGVSPPAMEVVLKMDMCPPAAEITVRNNSFKEKFSR